MDDAYAALLASAIAMCDLGHRIHGGAYDRNLKLDFGGQAGCASASGRRGHISGLQKDVVECQSFLNSTSGIMEFLSIVTTCLGSSGRRVPAPLDKNVHTHLLSWIDLAEQQQ